MAYGQKLKGTIKVKTNKEVKYSHAFPDSEYWVYKNNPLDNNESMIIAVRGACVGIDKRDIVNAKA